jgi:hypothetical protein
MVVFSSYPADPRPRRAIEAMLDEGATIDLICLADEKLPRSETRNGLTISRLPIQHSRGGVFSYLYQYFAFIGASAWLFGVRGLRHRYDLIHVHNMPDVLVFSAILPKILGAKVILDQHDPGERGLQAYFRRAELPA